MLKKILVIGYILGIVALSVYSTLTETQPALFWIDIFAPNTGDTYSIKLVILLTLLCGLLPLVFILALTILFQNRRTQVPVSPDETGVWINRKKQLQSALMPMPVFINNHKAGTVNMGQKTFFTVSSINLSIKAGNGKEESLPFEYELQPGEQLQLELEIVPEGLFSRCVLREVKI